MLRSTEKASKDEIENKSLYIIPPKFGRYIVLDTETTGLNKNDHIVELGAHEMIDGKLTGGQFHIYIKPRIQMDEIVISIHQITNDFYNEFYKDIYSNDKQNLINFLNWVDDSLIFAHNATFDMNALNTELKFWNLPEIPKNKFRCSMRIFKEIIGRIEPYFDDKFICLEKCCRFFELKSNKNSFHNALFDAFMTGRVISKLYEMLDNNLELRHELNYTCERGIINNMNNLNNKLDEIDHELKSESTVSSGGSDELTEKNREEKINTQLEKGELTIEMINEIFNELN